MPLLRRVNSFYCPVGRWPLRGWILLTRGDYDKINKFSNAFYLNISDTTRANNVGALRNLSIVQARCATRGLAADPNALYLVELTDPRGILQNQWFQFPLTTNYNIRAPAYPQTFHPNSMNGGTTWTWSTMLQNIWEQMTAFLGPWPGLPSTPAGTPEGFWFTGVPAWKALNDVLDHLGMVIACNLTQASPYTIVVQGQTDVTFRALQTRFTPNLEDDLEYIDYGAGRAPANVKVLFRRRNSVYGTEETVRYDSFQWDMTPYYSITVSAPSEYAGGLGTHYIWSDFTIRYDDSNNPLDADLNIAGAIARERVSQYFSVIDPGGYMEQVYAGALPFTTGAEVDGVRWYQDYSSQDRQGWKTEIVYKPGYDPPWDGLWN